MNQKTNELQKLNKYVQSCKVWELPFLKQECVQMIKMIDARLTNKPIPKEKFNLLSWIVRKIYQRRNKKNGG